jgi:hypothetical protein
MPSKLTPRRAGRPGDGCLVTARRFVFRSLTWTLKAAGTHPFSLVVEGDAEFENYRTGVGFTRHPDVARAAVVAAIVALTSTVKPGTLKFFFRCDPETCSASETQRILDRYRGVMAAHIDRAIRDAGYDGVIELRCGPREPRPPELTFEEMLGEITPAERARNRALLDRGDETIHSGASGLRTDTKSRPSGDGNRPQVISPPAHLLRALPNVKHNEPQPSDAALKKAITFVFDTLKPSARIVGRSPLKLGLSHTREIQAHLVGDRSATERNRANTSVIRAVAALVRQTDAEMFFKLGKSDRMEPPEPWRDRSSPFTRFMGEIRAVITEAIDRDGGDGLELVVQNGLADHARAFDHGL